MLCDNLKGWDGMGGRFKREETYVYMWLFLLMYGRNQHNIVKQSFSKKKKKKNYSLLQEHVTDRAQVCLNLWVYTLAVRTLRK